MSYSIFSSSSGGSGHASQQYTALDLIAGKEAEIWDRFLHCSDVGGDGTHPSPGDFASIPEWDAYINDRHDIACLGSVATPHASAYPRFITDHNGSWHAGIAWTRGQCMWLCNNWNNTTNRTFKTIGDSANIIMGCSNSTVGRLLSWGRALEFTDRHSGDDYGESYCCFSGAARVGILMEHPDIAALPFEPRMWEIRRLLRMSAHLYPTRTEREGFGTLYWRNAYDNGTSTSPWTAFDPCYENGDYFTYRTDYTATDLDNLINWILEKESDLVEPPAGISANCGYCAPDGTFVSSTEVVANTPEGSMGYGNMAIPKYDWPRQATNEDQHFDDYYVLDVDTENYKKVVLFSWCPFKSRHFKSTVITINDNFVYEGTDNHYMWMSNVTGSAHVKFYTRAQDGSLSRCDFCNQFTLLNLKKFARFSHNVGFKRYRAPIPRSVSPPIP